MDEGRDAGIEFAWETRPNITSVNDNWCCPECKGYGWINGSHIYEDVKYTVSCIACRSTGHKLGS